MNICSKSSYSVLKLRYRAHFSDYKISSHPKQNHSSVTLFTICVYECLINITILIICGYALNMNKSAELCITNMLQTSETELLTPPKKYNIHLTKSPKSPKHE